MADIFYRLLVAFQWDFHSSQPIGHCQGLDFLCKNAQKGSRMIHYDSIEHNITIIADVEAFLSVLTGWVF